MPYGVGLFYFWGGEIMSYEFKSKIIGYISEEIADKWEHPELSGKPIYQFAKIHRHIEKHYSQFILGEKSKDYTMKHLNDIISDPDYVCYNIKNNGFEYHKKLLEYVVVTVKPSNDNEDILCVSTVYPSSEEKMNNRIKKEQSTIQKILLEKYTYKQTN